MRTILQRAIVPLVLALVGAALVVPTTLASIGDTPWAGGGTGTTIVVSDGTSAPAEFTYQHEVDCCASGSWVFSTVANSTRTVELDWNYSGYHAFFQVRVRLDAFVFDGVTETIVPLVNDGPVNCCTPPSGGFSYSGNVSLSVQAGDTYGFKMSGSNFDSDGRLLGRLTVDEPTTQCVAPPSGMVGWWPGDVDANDIAGTNHGTLQNGAILAAGKVDQAFSFDGLDDFVRIPNSPSLNPTASLSIDAWIFPTAGGKDRAIAAQWGDSSPWGNQRAYLFYVNPDGKLIFAISDDANQGNPTFHHHSFTHSPQNSVPLNAWSHVAAVYEKSTSTGTRKIYLNGMLVADMTHNPLTITNSIADVSIGAWLQNPTSSQWPFSGLIDEVEIHHSALTQAEIQAIFLAGSAGKCKNQPPDALCKNVTVNTSPGLCTAPASVNNGSSDPDGDPITLSQTPAGPYAKGTTNVTLTVTDDEGASDSCTATVTVVDNQAPSISCPAPQTAECTGSSSATATFNASASDNCGFASTSCPASGNSFPLGTTQVSCSATDDSENSSNCTSTVTVVDTTKPVVSCVESVNPSGKKVPKASNTNQDGFYKVSGSDICSTPTIKIGSYVLASGETIKITQTPGKSGVSFVNTMGPEQIRHFQVGSGDAVITATDGSGNSSSVTCLVPPPPK